MPLKTAPSASLALQRATTTVQTNVGTKQAVLSAVPVGKVRIVEKMVFRNPSVDISSLADGFDFGTNAGGSNLGTVTPFAALSATTRAAQFPLGSLDTTGNYTQGAFTLFAGDIFGVACLDVSITATLDIDVFYYGVDV